MLMGSGGTAVGLIWTLAAVFGTLALALIRAEELRPDPMALHDKPLNRMLASLMGWLALVVVGIYSVYRYGIPIPALIGVALYVKYRLVLTRDLTPYYRYNLAIGVAALMSTGLVLASQILTGRPI